MVEMLTASQAFWKDKTEAQHRHHDERWFRLYAQELLAIMPSGGTLLDVGCGAAQLTTYLAGQFDSIIGIDLSEVDACSWTGPHCESGTTSSARKERSHGVAFRVQFHRRNFGLWRHPVLRYGSTTETCNGMCARFEA